MAVFRERTTHRIKCAYLDGACTTAVEWTTYEPTPTYPLPPEREKALRVVGWTCSRQSQATAWPRWFCPAHPLPTHLAA